MRSMDDAYRGSWSIMPDMLPIKCFMIEPVLGEELQGRADGRDWPPNQEIIGWRRVDNGLIFRHNSQHDVGAMWYATWIPKNWDWDNEIEPHLHVRCPNGPNDTRDWDIDSRASNCGLPNDKLHRCWIRNGTAPYITVNKAGTTCNAGAGSISLPKWHGYLTKGVLIDA